MLEKQEINRIESNIEFVWWKWSKYLHIQQDGVSSNNSHNAVLHELHLPAIRLHEKRVQWHLFIHPHQSRPKRTV